RRRGRPRRGQGARRGHAGRRAVPVRGRPALLRRQHAADVRPGRGRAVVGAIADTAACLMTDLLVRQLDPTTWPDFAALVERHNGVWGGCWCMSFHEEGVSNTKPPARSRAEKETRVREGRAHAALVYDGDRCVGWCQFGSVEELPRIKHKRAYLASATVLPNW